MLNKMQLDVNKVREYIQRNYGDSPNTLKQYNDLLRRYARSFNMVDEESILRFLSLYKNNTINRAFCKLLMRVYRLTEREVQLEKKKTRTAKKELKYFTKQQIDILIDNLSPKLSLLVSICFDTGLRNSEVMNLRRTDIDLINKTVKGVGKGNKAFKEKLREKTAIKLSAYLNNNDQEYPFHYEGLIHQHKKFWYEIRKEAEALGIEKVRPHMIRHGLGTHLFNLGWDITDIREKLRHVSIQTTSIYINTSREKMLKKQEELFNSENT